VVAGNLTQDGFSTLMGLFAQTIWLFYGLTGVAVLVLRRRRVGEEGVLRAPGGLMAPGVLIAAAVGMTTALAIEEPKRFILGLALVAIAAPVYAVVTARRGLL
jgi:amino acid transporter